MKRIISNALASCGRLAARVVTKVKRLGVQEHAAKFFYHGYTGCAGDFNYANRYCCTLTVVSQVVIVVML